MYEKSVLRVVKNGRYKNVAFAFYTKTLSRTVTGHPANKKFLILN